MLKIIAAIALGIPLGFAIVAGASYGVMRHAENDMIVNMEKMTATLDSAFQDDAPAIVPERACTAYVDDDAALAACFAALPSSPFAACMDYATERMRFDVAVERCIDATD